MAVINESEFGRITAIYERQAQACVRSVEDFYDEITELSRKTAYEPLVNFTNQIYEFYKGELRDHLRREFANWYDSEYSLHALARSILAGEDAVRNARGHMDVMGEHLDQMFRRGPNPIHVDTGEPRFGRTAQGYSDSSCWARGQAWGVYGFALSFHHTGDRSFLDTSCRLLDYFLARLPEDGVC